MSNKNQTKTMRGREKACDGELKNTHKIVYNPKYCYKNIYIYIMLHQPKVKLQERINNRERE